jgi:hypothetical protein
MSAQPGLAGLESAEEIEADRAAREDDPTPRLVVRSVLAAALMQVNIACAGRPLRVLDVCAGFGCWASEMRRYVLGHVVIKHRPIHITGVEIDGRKREHLTKWCDDVRIGDWREAVAGLEFDLVIGNPHFSALTHDDDVAKSMPAVLLGHAPHVLLLHQTANFTRSLAGRDTMRAYPPTWVGIIPGSVGFRGRKRGADLRSYQATLWTRGHTGPFAGELLPDPPPRPTKRGHERASSWHWDTPPGTEHPSADLPAAQGWSARECDAKTAVTPAR